MIQSFIMRRLQYNQSTRRFFITIAALGFAIDGVYTVLLNLYLLRLGYDPQYIGQINAVGLLTFAVTGLPAGLLGSRWSSKQMMRVGLGIIVIGTVFLPLSELAPAALQGLWLMVTYALVLMGFALYFVNGAPFLMAAVEQNKQKNAFALQTALLSFAGFIGSLFGGTLPEWIARFQSYTLDDPQPYRFTLMGVAVVMIAAFFVILTVDDKFNHEQPAEEKEPDSAPSIQLPSLSQSLIFLVILMSLIRFLQVAGVATANIFFNVYMDTELGLTSGSIGIITAFGRLIGVPAALLAPRLIQRFGTGGVAVLASFATGVFLIPLALFPVWQMAALGFIGSGAMSSLRFTGFIVFLMELVPPKRQALIAGAGEMAAGLSFALMALGGGYIVALFSFRETFLLGAGLTFGGTLMLWLYLQSERVRRKRKLII